MNDDTRLDERVRSLLVQRKGDWPGIAQRADVSHSWISQFVRGKIPNPGFATLLRLDAELNSAAGAGAATATATEPGGATQQAAA